jgi:response regulator RpfG family c-di-GMP phosphodiesterase
LSAPRRVVLLVDDEAHILSALQRTLRKEPYDVLTARGAAEALALLASREVAVLVSDQKMPGASGIELLREAAARHPRTRRVLLTGWPEEVPAREREAARLDAILLKPWDEAELKATLARCVAG